MATNVMPLVTTSPSGTNNAIVATIPVQAAPHADIQRCIAARLRAGVSPAMLVREQLALIAVLQNKPFIDKMAGLYVDAMREQQSDEKYALPLKEALRELAPILQNRSRDAQQLIGLLNDPAFMARASHEATQPAPTEPFKLSPEKSEEVVRRLVQEADAHGAEPAVHVAAYARGQRTTHQALANLFRPQSEKAVLFKPLVDALTTVWPDAPQDAREQCANSWLKARHDAAHSTADGLAQNETGALYQEAMRRAEALQAKKLATASVTQINAPATQVITPAPTIARVTAKNELMLDSLS